MLAGDGGRGCLKICPGNLTWRNGQGITFSDLKKEMSAALTTSHPLSTHTERLPTRPASLLVYVSLALARPSLQVLLSVACYHRFTFWAGPGTRENFVPTACLVSHFLCDEGGRKPLMLRQIGSGCISCSWMQWAKALWLVIENGHRHRWKEKALAYPTLAFPAHVTSKESFDVGA